MKAGLTNILFSISIIALSCSNEQRLPDGWKKQVSTEVRETLNNYFKDISNHGLKAEFAYLDSSGDFFWVPPGFSSAISYDSVVSILDKNTKLFSSVNNQFDTLLIIPVSADIATYTGRITSTMTLINGKSSTLTMLETGTMIKRKSGWKLLCGQTTMLPKPAEQITSQNP